MTACREHRENAECLGECKIPHVLFNLINVAIAASQVKSRQYAQPPVHIFAPSIQLFRLPS